jgi:hypothetical protein
MVTDTSDRTGVTANGIDNTTKLILSIFLVPAPFELVTAFAKRENYDYHRLIVVGGLLVVLAVVVAIWQRRHTRVQSAIGVYLIVVGSAVTALGVVLTFRPDLLLHPDTWTPTVETTFSALTPAAGVLLLTAGIYLVRDQIRRTHDDASAPSPRTIANPKPLRIGDIDGSVWRSPHFGQHPAAAGLIDLCQVHLSTTDLHFVAFYTPADECLFYVDVLDDERMRRFNVRDTADRRRQYEQVGRYARSITRRMDRRFRGLASGMLVRLVLDVEKGAIFYYKLRDVGYLVGVTLDQTEVDPTDRKLSELANQILPHLGGRPDDDFYRK